MARIPFFNKDDDTADAPPWREAFENARAVNDRLLGLENDGDQDPTFCVSASPIVDDRGVSRGVLASFKDIIYTSNLKLNHVVNNVCGFCQH